MIVMAGSGLRERPSTDEAIRLEAARHTFPAQENAEPLKNHQNPEYLKLL